MPAGTAEVFRRRRPDARLGRVEAYVRAVPDGDAFRLVGAIRPSRLWQGLAVTAPLYVAVAVARAVDGDPTLVLVAAGLLLTLGNVARRAPASRAAVRRQLGVGHDR